MEKDNNNCDSNNNVDKSLLKLEKKLELNNGTNSIIENKFILKPVMKLEYKSKFLTKDKLDFLEEFKKSTIDITKDKSNEINRNIEIEDSKQDKKKKYIQMDLDLGVLDILPSSNNIHNGSTMDTASCISLNSENFDKNDNLLLNESKDSSSFMPFPNFSIKTINNTDLKSLLENKENIPEHKNS